MSGRCRLSPTQFAWYRCLGMEDYPPPRARYGPDRECWLCGWPTGPRGWPRALAIAPTFTNYTLAASLWSSTVCQACVALSQSEGWGRYVRAHPERGFSESFPAKVGKAKRLWNWLYSSHVFRPGHHECPNRARWREILLDPPEPPFMLVMAVSGKKQIIFRARIAPSRSAYSVQADDVPIYVDRALFNDCLAAFEAAYALGLSKDSILSGRYPMAAISKVGLAGFRAAEAATRPWRERHKGLMQLAHYCAQRTEAEA